MPHFFSHLQQPRRSFASIAWLLVVVPLQAEPSPSPEVKSSPSIDQPKSTYQGRQIAKTMSYHGASWLTRSSREQEERSSMLLEALEVQPGQTVCDLGCGNGFHTLKLARLVGPRGRVLAVDIQPEMLRLLEFRAQEAGFENIETILSGPDDPKLPAASMDLVLLVDVYHELSHPEAVLQAIHASLKPTGRIALVEYRTEDPEVPIKRLHKMSKRQIMKEYPPNNLKLVGEFNQLPWQHLMFFARSDSSLPEIKPMEWKKSDKKSDRQ